MRLRRFVLPWGLAVLAGCQLHGPVPSVSTPVRVAAQATSDGTGYGALDAVSETNLRNAVWGMVNTHKQSPQTTIDTPYGVRQHSSIANYVAQAFKNATGQTPVKEDFVQNGYAGTNVYVDIPGSTEPNQVILVSAHHDTWWYSADDDTSAIAAMFEAARILATRKPEKTVRFLAFDGEELGDLGAQAFIDRHESDSLDYLVDVNMEGMAFCSSTPDSQQQLSGMSVPNTANFMLAASNDAAGAYLADFAKAAGALPPPYQLVTQSFSGAPSTWPTQDLRRSDQDLFWQMGFPAVFLTDTLPFRNPNYHTPTDTPMTLDFAFMRQATQTLVGGLALISGAQLQ
ncbi:MAG TPA: M20/M25/M40 family metallo-hydrolase [Oscillatoriaceae cyanobacterium]